jgi:hypothetical protein
VNEWLVSLVDKGVQCWGCAVFDRLFMIVSSAAGLVYDHFSKICIILFCVLFTVFVLNAIWKNIKGGVSDPWLTKSVQKVLLSAVIALTVMGMGVAFPRFVTTVIFEPVADITLVYSQSMINSTDEIVNEKVTYEPIELSQDGFYRPELRDKIIMLMKTTVTQFQSYIKLGIALMDSAFSWSALLGIGALLKHIIMFFIGMYIAKEFVVIFFRYCCYFVDIIISLAFFGVFFPLSLVAFAFKGAEHVPEWISKLGGSLGVGQIKNVINSIVTLGSVIITYTIIMVMITKFFTASGTDLNELMDYVTTGQVFADVLNSETLQSMTLIGCAVLMFVLNYIMDQIPQVSKMILSAFGVQEKSDASEDFANSVSKFIDKRIEQGKDFVKKIKGDSADGASGSATSGGTTGGA